tara:strand:- start:713 stop:889 length:177 start_codon:yes stop_codon:yes gene_type:complete
MTDYRSYEEIPKVTESKGECKRYGCNTFGLLGNGYCVTCWDRRDRDSLREKRKGKKDE